MSEDEFDLLDELYFLQPYSYIKNTLNWEDDKLFITLQKLLEKGLIKCFHSPEEEVFDQTDLALEGKKYYYLATKKGLLEHNSL